MDAGLQEQNHLLDLDLSLRYITVSKCRLFNGLFFVPVHFMYVDRTENSFFIVWKNRMLISQLPYPNYPTTPTNLDSLYSWNKEINCDEDLFTGSRDGWNIYNLILFSKSRTAFLF